MNSTMPNSKGSPRKRKRFASGRFTLENMREIEKPGPGSISNMFSSSEDEKV